MSSGAGDSGAPISRRLRRSSARTCSGRAASSASNRKPPSDSCLLPFGDRDADAGLFLFPDDVSSPLPSNDANSMPGTATSPPPPPAACRSPSACMSPSEGAYPLPLRARGADRPACTSWDVWAACVSPIHSQSTTGENTNPEGSTIAAFASCCSLCASRRRLVSGSRSVDTAGARPRGLRCICTVRRSLVESTSPS